MPPSDGLSNVKVMLSPSPPPGPPSTTLDANVRRIDSSSMPRAMASSQNRARSRSSSAASTALVTDSSSRRMSCLLLSASMRSLPPGGAMPDSMAVQMFENETSMPASSSSMSSLCFRSPPRSDSAATSSSAILSRFPGLPRASRTAPATRASTSSRPIVRPQARQR